MIDFLGRRVVAVFLGSAIVAAGFCIAFAERAI